MKQTMKSRLQSSLPILAMAFGWLLFCAPFAALAGPQTQAGPYHLELTTETGHVPATGRAKLLIKVTDASGKPMEGVTIRSLTKMSGMSMGEREETALPVAGQPGVYTALAQFAMEGGYEASLKINGPQGAASATLSLNTGETTGTLANAAGAGSAAGGGSAANAGAQAASDSSNAAASLWGLLPWLAAGSIILFLAYRMRRTGQRPSLRGLANRSVIGGLILLGLIFWGATYAVNHFRRPGAMTPIEVQAMDMNLPAPIGTAPVELAAVTRGPMESVTRYTGQAVGFVEQDVTPRVSGVLLWMPLYAGDTVKRGQLLARLDTSQSAPQEAAQRGILAMARQGTEVARKDYDQALAMINEAHAEVGMKTGAVESARADLQAAREERANAQSGLDAAQSLTSDADAQLQAAQADQTYWREEISREASLLKGGAVTQEEYQREQAQAENADAKVRQAQARVVQVQAQIRAALSGVRKADALIASAQSKISQAQSDLNAHEAHVRSALAASNSARQKIAQAQAGETQARAGLSGASATQGYSEIRSQTDGVVTQRVTSPGVLVGPGQTLLRIAQIAPIRLQANVSEADLPKLRVGSRVLANHQDGDSRPLAARITSVAPSVDPTARTGIVEAVVPNRDRRFLPGQYVTLDISTGGSANALRIPTRALRYHATPSGGAVSTQTTPSVWVATPIMGQAGQYTVRETAVKTGLSDTNDTEVVAGLEAGQRVVIAGQDYLQNGDTVSPTNATPQVAANRSPAPAAPMKTMTLVPRRTGGAR